VLLYYGDGDAANFSVLDCSLLRKSIASKSGFSTDSLGETGTLTTMSASRLLGYLLRSLMAVLLFHACVSNTSYPKQWAEGYPGLSLTSPIDEMVCELTGFYDNIGEAPPGQEGPTTISLFGLLFQGPTSIPSNESSVVELTGPDQGIINFTLWSRSSAKQIATGFLRSVQDGIMSPGRYICLKNGVVIVTAESGGGGAIIGLAAGSQQSSLFRGKDGKLVLRETKTKMFIPVYLDIEGHWYRFRPIQKEEDVR
jgi:hypothetical protein